MTSSRNVSQKSLVRWLLEKENPSVRYFTLRDLLNRREDDPELQAAKSEIPASKVVAKIFSKQKPEGYNILRGLDVLTKLGYVENERLSDAVHFCCKSGVQTEHGFLKALQLAECKLTLKA